MFKDKYLLFKNKEVNIDKKYYETFFKASRPESKSNKEKYQSNVIEINLIHP